MSIDVVHGAHLQADAPRAFGRAFWRGLRCRCPNCGEGKLFTSYLKVTPACSVCGEDYTPQRADDAPPYFTIFIVGHLVVPPLLYVENHYSPELWIHFLTWIPLTALLCVLFLQPIKGAVVGWQWAQRMHGFDPTSDEARETKKLEAARLERLG